MRAITPRRYGHTRTIMGATIPLGWLPPPPNLRGMMMMNDEEWLPMEDIPQPGAWQRIAQKMGVVVTPELINRVEHRRRQRRSEGLIRQARFDEPPAPSAPDIWRLVDKVDDLIDAINTRRRPSQVRAPPRPPEPPPPIDRPVPSRRPTWTDTP